MDMKRLTEWSGDRWIARQDMRGVGDKAVYARLAALEDILFAPNGTLRLTLERIEELAQADAEGRCVVLPQDGMLYHIEEVIETGDRWVGNKPIQKITITCGFGLVGIPLDFSQIGKTVFLTREEAEAAMVGRDG